jgi:hypothetical protein
LLPLDNDSKEDNDSDSSAELTYGMKLHHLDRIFIGMNTLFLFKYPLMKKAQDDQAMALNYDIEDLDEK